MTHWKQKILNKSLFKSLSPDISDPIVCAIASLRNYGIENINDFYSFINNDLKDLNDPNIIPNINEIVDIFTNPPESAYIFGDYDVDGTFSSFMLKNILYSGGCKDINFFIPHRKQDGYGLNTRSVQNFINKINNKKIGLIIFLDCGTNSKNEIEILKKQLDNPKIVIIDHHIVDEENFSTNADVIINNRLSNGVPQYSTGGLVYQVAKKLDKNLKFNPDKLLPYAAIATIADVSPLCGDNRIIVANGLKQISKIKNHGLLELIRVSGINAENCTTEDISFKIAPRINANGRIEHADKVLSLLNEKDEDKAFGMALEMNAINDTRKKLQKQMIEQAMKLVGPKYDKQSLIVYNDKWEIGIVGIVASRLVETYGVPTIVFGNHDGKIKGSARSIKGINIKSVMDKVSYLFEAYGGHEMAAGATLKNEYIKTANDIFEKAIIEYKLEMKVEKTPIEYDIVVKNSTFQTIDNEFCEKIQKFGPFGQDNEKITFRANNVKCKSVKEWGSGSGAFIYFDGLNMDCFIYESNASEKLEGKTIDILFEVGENFKDGEKWALIIKSFKSPVKYYAGIGSRSTPNDVLDLMTKISSHFSTKGYVLRSGGANGADMAFESGANDKKEIYLPWPSFNNNNSQYDGEKWKYKKIHLNLARKHHPSFDSLKQGVKKMMIRNSAQIIGKDSSDTPSSFVICYTPDGKDSGGTGQAIRLAKSMGIKVHNLYDKKTRKKFEEII